MIGISYLTDPVARSMAQRIETMVQDRRYDHVFWEDALFAENGMPVQAKIVPEGAVVEINTYEQLRELDENSDQLKSDAMAEIERVLSVSGEEITGIEVLKKGMTNRSFLFRCRGGRYIMRIPGEGTSLLINRRQRYIGHWTERASAMKSCRSIRKTAIRLRNTWRVRVSAIRKTLRMCRPV